MRRSLAGLGAALALGACQTTGAVLPPEPCSPLVLAEVEAEPIVPPLTEAQHQAAYKALFQALGEPLTVAWVRAVEVSVPAWGRRQAARVTVQREACLTDQGGL